MHHLVALSVVGENLVLLFALVVDDLFGVLQVFLLLRRHLLRLLARLALVQGGKARLLALQVALYRLQLLLHAVLGVVEHFLHELMVGVEHHHVRVGHLVVEAHSRLEPAHLLHAAHILALRDDDRRVGLAQCLHVHGVCRLVTIRHLRTEHLCQFVTVVFCHLFLLGVFLDNEAVDDVGVDT